MKKLEGDILSKIVKSIFEVCLNRKTKINFWETVSLKRGRPLKLKKIKLVNIGVTIWPTIEKPSNSGLKYLMGGKLNKFFMEEPDLLISKTDKNKVLKNDEEKRGIVVCDGLLDSKPIGKGPIVYTSAA